MHSNIYQCYTLVAPRRRTSICCIQFLWADKYVSGDWPISTHADPTFTCRALFYERRISSV